MKNAKRKMKNRSCVLRTVLLKPSAFLKSALKTVPFLIFTFQLSCGLFFRRRRLQNRTKCTASIFNFSFFVFNF
ncbi:MAG: hypothetical protein JSV88_05060, partial [Candidatus Aminicenantes bacterium]